MDEREKVIKEITRLAQGNPGAATFLMRAAQADIVFFWILTVELDRMGLKGTHLWILYNDLCNQDLEKVGKLIATAPRQLIIQAATQEDRGGYILVDQYLK